MSKLLALRAEHEAWHMVTLDHIFGDRVKWKRVWVTADERAAIGGETEATIGTGGRTLSLLDAAPDLDRATRQGLYTVLLAAHWGTVKKYGMDVANEQAFSDMEQEKMLAVSDEGAQSAVRVLVAANLDYRVEYVARMLEMQLEFDSDDCLDVLLTSKMSPEERDAENQQALDALKSVEEVLKRIRSM